MSEKESMQELMKRENEEMLVTINRANSALLRIFKIEEGESLQERADRTNPYLLKKEGDDE
jgi:hypothetical protein